MAKKERLPQHPERADLIVVIMNTAVAYEFSNSDPSSCGHTDGRSLLVQATLTIDISRNYGSYHSTHFAHINNLSS